MLAVFVLSFVVLNAVTALASNAPVVKGQQTETSVPPVKSDFQMSYIPSSITTLFHLTFGKLIILPIYPDNNQKSNPELYLGPPSSNEENSSCPWLAPLYDNGWNHSK